MAFINEKSMLKEKNSLSLYSTAQGLPNNSIRGILEDNNGNLWISTNNGLSCYHQAENRFINYTIQDGLIDIHSFIGTPHVVLLMTYSILAV